MSPGDSVYIAYTEYDEYINYIYDVALYQHGENSELPDNTPEWSYTGAVIIGTHNSKSLFPRFSDAALLPLPALESLLGQNQGYVSFRFGIDPSLNRDLQSVGANLEQAIRFRPIQWFNLLSLNIYDEELRHVIEPMEQSLSLFKLLYPVAITLSVVFGAGLAILLLLQNAKNAAILSVLGTTKGKTRLMLWLELMLVCLAGAVIGIIILAVVSLRFDVSLLVAALPYIVGSFSGAAIGALLVTNRAPLDLLQVKE